MIHIGMEFHPTKILRKIVTAPSLTMACGCALCWHHNNNTIDLCLEKIFTKIGMHNNDKSCNNVVFICLSASEQTSEPARWWICKQCTTDNLTDGLGALFVSHIIEKDDNVCTL